VALRYKHIRAHVARRAIPAFVLGLALASVTVDIDEASPRDSEDESRAGQTAYAAGRFVDALSIWRPLAERGDPRAAFGLGLLYDLGEGVEQDAAAAYSWYRRAAEAGFVPAEFNLAVMHDSGVGTARNPAAAALWYASAAAHGHPRAEYNLAQLYEAGVGVPHNRDMAEAWYAAAADHGLAAASSKVRSLRATGARTTLPAVPLEALSAATPIGPPVTQLDGRGDSVTAELSFAAPMHAMPVVFFVEVAAIERTGTRVAFGSYAKLSAILVELPPTPKHYAWRVYTVAASIPDHVVSPWRHFSVR
jgi:hypothetical protein